MIPVNILLMATFEDFQKIDIRVGRILSAEKLPGAKHSTHKLVIDLGGTIGKKVSCARLAKYREDEIVGRLVLCVVNFPPRQIGKIMSEVLTLGVPGADNEAVLAVPERGVPIGGRLY